MRLPEVTVRTKMCASFSIVIVSRCSIYRRSSSRHKITCFKVTIQGMKTTLNLQRGKVRNAVLVSFRRAVKGLKYFRGLEAFILLAAFLAFEISSK